MTTAASQVVYRSHVRIERVKGPIRKVWLPGEHHAVTFGLHEPIAEHYPSPPKVLEPHAAPLDYIVAATAADLMGTFGAALEARQIDASHGRLISETVGEIEREDGVLVIRRIHTHFNLKAGESERELAQRIHASFAGGCPAYRTLKSAIAISTELSIEPESEDLILGDQGQPGG